MKQKLRPSESPDKAEANESEAATPMAKFKDLTRSLLNVSRTELQTEQKRYLEERSVKKSADPSTGSRRTKK
jgi:hypothetical protein